MIYFPERKLAQNLFVALGDVKNAEPLNRQLIDFVELFSTRASISHPRRQILNEISFLFFSSSPSALVFPALPSSVP